MRLSEYLTFTHNHILENVKFADQKATAIIALDLAVFAGIFGLDGEVRGGALLGLAFLSLGIAVAGYVIWPRRHWITKKTEYSGLGTLSLPGKIAEFDVGAYHQLVTDDSADLYSELTTLVSVMSKIYQEKYRLLSNAMVCSLLGSIFSGVWAVSTVV